MYFQLKYTGLWMPLFRSSGLKVSCLLTMVPSIVPLSETPWLVWFVCVYCACVWTLCTQKQRMQMTSSVLFQPCLPASLKQSFPAPEARLVVTKTQPSSSLCPTQCWDHIQGHAQLLIWELFELRSLCFQSKSSYPLSHLPRLPLCSRTQNCSCLRERIRDEFHIWLTFPVWSGISSVVKPWIISPRNHECSHQIG